MTRQETIAMHRRRLRTTLAVPLVSNATTQARPQESLALSVHRSQAAEFNKLYRDAGITSAHHKPDGTAVLESRQGRNQVLKLRKMRDNDAGYGDHAGR